MNFIRMGGRRYIGLYSLVFHSYKLCEVHCCFVNFYYFALQYNVYDVLNDQQSSIYRIKQNYYLFTTHNFAVYCSNVPIALLEVNN